MLKKSDNPGHIDLLVPIGHYYSPIVDPVDIKMREDVVWAWRNEMPGIDLNVDAQFELLRQLKPYVASVPYPTEQPKDPQTYFYKNGQYPALDAEFLHAALSFFKPKNMIEIGSGFSSLVTANVNRSILDLQLDFTCIEPYPRQFLIDGIPGITRLIQQKVEEADLELFNRLDDGDILFVDSSHVSKVGSDVNFIFFEILPRLKEGVIVHIHDIFLPDEYPKVWVYEGWNWNEQYLLRAFLLNNAEWEIIWATSFMSSRHTNAVHETFPRFPELAGGASMWIRKIKK